MRALHTPLRSIKAPALLIALALLQACGTTPEVASPTSKPVVPATNQPEDRAARLVLPTSIFQAEFADADAALATGDWMRATVPLAPLQESPLNTTDSDYLQYMLARVDYQRGNPDSAYSRLEQIDRADLHPGIAYRVHNFQRHLLDLQGQYLQSGRLGVRLMAIAPDTDLAALKRSIWRDLQRCSEQQIAEARGTVTDATWLGWLALASIDNNSAMALGVELQTWQSSYPQHPAGEPLPGGLEFLLQPTPAPDLVTLLLPLSGRLAPAGKAVRDGYLASYFRARGQGEAPNQIQVIDSNLYGSATEAYTDAVLQGAQLVIGPLEKTAVSELAAQPQRPVPVIALNRIDETAAPAPSALVQLSLSPEDEAEQLASMAFGTGARHALVLRPNGVWGDKIEAALASQWGNLGGTVVDSISYAGKDDYSASVKTGLGIQASEQRRGKVRDMLATNVEFTPRRRQDIDAIFMLSRTPEEARAIKPLLAFHYAGGLPVYATSSIHGGRPDSRDRDLDGTRILELPWLLGSDAPLQVALADRNGHQYSRLHALGADAYRVQSRFGQLQAGPDVLIKGDTGLLSLNPKLQIERELPAAVFDGDRLQPQ